MLRALSVFRYPGWYAGHFYFETVAPCCESQLRMVGGFQHLFPLCPIRVALGPLFNVGTVRRQCCHDLLFGQPLSEDGQRIAFVMTNEKLIQHCGTEACAERVELRPDGVFQQIYDSISCLPNQIRWWSPPGRRSEFPPRVAMASEGPVRPESVSPLRICRRQRLEEVYCRVVLTHFDNKRVRGHGTNSRSAIAIGDDRTSFPRSSTDRKIWRSEA